MVERIVMFTDGGSRNNPGPAAVGVFIETLDKKFGHYIGEKTNNEAEYEAVLFGLNKIKQLVGKDKVKNIKVECRLDSQLVERQLKHEYKLSQPHIQQLFIQVWNLMLDFKSVSFHYVPREQNKVADAMVNEALDAEQNKLF